MKNLYLAILAALLASMLLIPLVAVSPQKDSITPLPQGQKENKVRLFITETEKIEKMDIDEYIFGAVAAEMPADYSAEALKSQAVCAYTFYLYRSAQNKDKDYDITDSPLTDQAYLSTESLKEKWGEDYTANSEKVAQAVKAVSGMAITYEGSPILAAYHAISPGKTSAAADVWGGDYPYLAAVDSIGDLLCPEYLSTVTVSTEDFKNALKEKVEFSGEPKGWIGEITPDSGSGVKEIKICGTTVTGSAVRELLKLRSTAFDVAYSEEKGFTFTVRGYGHGVGLSQYGANYMALQGSTYIEILSWYYKDCQLKKL